MHALPEAMVMLWDNFGTIYEQLLINDDDDHHISQLERDTKDWILLFISLYQTKHVTPYMHALLQHVPEIMSIHISLVKFNQQELEKLNNNQTKDFYRSTNLRGTEAMVMLWDNFGTIYEQLLINDDDNHHISQLERDTKDWILLFISLYQTKHVTPYMHALLQHVPEIMSIHISLVKFNQQELEKLNNNQTKDFYRSTNLRGTEAMVMLWDNFGTIYEQLLINDDDDHHISQLERDIKDWILLFISLYQTKHVTPYMHALLQHVPEIMSIHISLVKFNQQGLEKLNNNQTKDFYRSTNLRGTEAMVMLLQKKNRLEDLEDTGYKDRKALKNVQLVLKLAIM